MELADGYKQTEVGPIPDDWLEHTIGDLISFSGGSQPDKSYFSPVKKPGHVRLIQIRDYKTEKYITFVPECLARKFCDSNDIMIARYGPPVFQILRGLDGAYNVALIKASPNNHVSRRYAYYYLKRDELFQLIEKLSRRSSGQTGVDLVELKAYPFPLPPTKAEQEAIAGALSDTDAWIESLEQLIAKKRRIKAGSMQALLTGKQRLPGFSGEWEVKMLRSLADLYQPETIGSSEFSTSGFLVYGANGVIGQYHRYNHEKPQVTISCRGNCGTVNRTQPFSWITGNAMVVNLEKNRSVDHDFVYHQLREQDYTDIITGSGQPQIVRGPLGAFEISLPPTKAEQTAIADILLDMDTELDALAAKLSKARQIKQGMMQELLTGKTRLV